MSCVGRRSRSEAESREGVVDECTRILILLGAAEGSERVPPRPSRPPMARGCDAVGRNG